MCMFFAWLSLPVYNDGGIPLLSYCKVALTMIQWDYLSQNINLWQTRANAVIHMTLVRCYSFTGRNTSAHKRSKSEITWHTLDWQWKGLECAEPCERKKHLQCENPESWSCFLWAVTLKSEQVKNPEPKMVRKAWFDWPQNCALKSCCQTYLLVMSMRKVNLCVCASRAPPAHDLHIFSHIVDVHLHVRPKEPFIEQNLSGIARLGAVTPGTRPGWIPAAAALPPTPAGDALMLLATVSFSW
jgi:hypothetical protein